MNDLILTRDTGKSEIYDASCNANDVNVSQRKILEKLKSLSPDFAEAEKFLNALAQSGDDQGYTFQVFPDSEFAALGGNRPRIYHGKLKELFEKLTDENRDGAGIFVCINRTDLKGRKAENVTSIRANYIDKDDGQINQYPLLPSAVVESKSGDHTYLFRSDHSSLDSFSADQKLLIEYYKSDRVVHDLPRVLRMPGFYHLKNPAEPFKIRIRELNAVRYTREEILAAHQSAISGKNLDQKRQGHKTISKFDKWVNSQPVEKGAANKNGGRNNTALIICREGLGRNIEFDKLKSMVEDYCRRSGLPKIDGLNMLKRQMDEHKRTPFASSTGNEPKGLNPANLADRLMVDKEWHFDGEFRLRSWRGDLYIYRDGVFVCRSKTDMRAEILRWMQCQPDVRSKSNPKNANDIMANAEAMVIIPSLTEVPVLIGAHGVFNSASDTIVMKNGVIVINRTDKENRIKLVPHSANLFSLAALPYNYDPNVTAPTWLNFLNSSFPDLDIQLLIQEIFGLALIYEISFHKFFIFYGEGANGKSVLLLILRLLVGEANVSSVGLEGFDATRTFPLAATIGKLVNIVEELNETDKASEGLLKQFVSGGTITIEKKHRDAFDLTPCARLVFATNILPRFNDKSKGMQRRIILIPCLHSILDESKQDRRLSQKEFWLSSGELPGVFNWALEGLFRLLDRGRFNEPEICVNARRDYEMDINPARQFLLEHFRPSTTGKYPKPEAYRHYRQWCEANGYKSLATGGFAKEVRRVFSEVTESPYPVQQANKSRQREWIGIEPGEVDLPVEDHGLAF